MPPPSLHAAHDEPDVFEADSCRPAPVLTSFARPAEPLSFGDDDAPTADILLPAQAFEVFAGRTFPVASPHVFYGPPGAAPSPAGCAKIGRESLRDRVERLRAEVWEVSDGGGGSAELCLSELRAVLDGLAAKGEKAGSEAVGGGPGGETLTRAGVRDMDRRVAALEASVGAGADAGPGGLWGLVESARAAVATEGYAEARAEATRLAEVLAGNEEVAEAVDVAALLQRLAVIEPAAAAIPTIVARLRTVRFGLDDNRAMLRAVGAVAQRCEAVAGARRENAQLVKIVKDGLELNAKSVAKNMEELEKRLQKAIAVRAEEGS